MSSSKQTVLTPELVNSEKDIREYVRQQSDDKDVGVRLEGLMRAAVSLGQELLRIRREKLSIVEDNIKLVERSTAVLNELNSINEKKERLELLSRELQHRYNTTTEKHKQELQQESKKRLELHNQFESSIQDISRRLEEERVQREGQTQAGQALQTKVMALLKEYDQKEKQYRLQIEKCSIELELSQSKFQQQVLINTELQDSAHDQLVNSMKREELLKNQMSTYNDKFDSITELVSKNKDALNLYQTELKKVTDMNKQLMNDNEFMKKKSVKTDSMLIEFEKNKRSQQKAVDQLTDQRNALQGLCKSLQEERKLLQERLQNTVVIAAIPVDTEAPPPPVLPLGEP